MAPQPTKCWTDRIGRRQAERVFHAVRFAKSKGRVMNTHITISFTDLGLTEEAASGFFSGVRNSFARRWKREREVKGRPIGTLDDVHAHENPAGGPRHVHWLMHRPRGMGRAEFERELTRRIQRRAGLDDLGTALHFQHGDKVKGPGTLAKYILKGTDAAYGGYFHMRTEPMGRVSGRRTGTSRTLGKAAQKAAKWNRKAPAAANDSGVRAAKLAAA